MIERVKLTNFKCFENLDVELSKLNVLAGINSMGKSTVIQALLLLRQAHELGTLFTGLHLNGNLVNIGTGRDVLYKDSDEDFFSIELITSQDKEQCQYMWKYGYQYDSDFQMLASTNSEGHCGKLNLFDTDFSYISADRLGPQKIYEKSYHQVVDKKLLGTRGELFVDFLSEFGDMMIENENVLHPIANSSTLLNQTQAWLSEISPGIKINTKKYSEAGLVGMSFSEEGYTPLNVGFGLSYVAPIVVAVLKAKPGDLIILENPEAHLHPRGQRKMGELLSSACDGGVQIIVETHSDHLLNGIRLSVKNKKIDRNKIRLNYFYTDTIAVDKTRKTIHQKCSPAILDNGALSAWPDGFFDEWDKAADELF